MGCNDPVAAADRRLLADAGVLAVNVMASPGAGKTSYLQYLALQYTRPEASQGLLPVLVELNAYTARVSFLVFVRDFLRNPPNPDPPEPPFDVQSPWMTAALEEQLLGGRLLRGPPAFLPPDLLYGRRGLRFLARRGDGQWMVAASCALRR